MLNSVANTEQADSVHSMIYDLNKFGLSVKFAQIKLKGGERGAVFQVRR